MKKNLIIVLLLSLMMISCERESVKPESDARLVGEWELKAYCNMPAEPGYYWIVTDNGEFTVSVDRPNQYVFSVGTYTFKNDTIKFDCDYYGKGEAVVSEITKNSFVCHFYIGGGPHYFERK